MNLPENHPLRIELNDEVLARPPQAIAVPARVSYLALISPPENADRERAHISELCKRKGLPAPERVGNHHIADFGAFRVKWERHAEFARYKIIAEGDAE
jgi:uncharacterized membrane-anchored protein